MFIEEDQNKGNAEHRATICTCLLNIKKKNSKMMYVHNIYFLICNNFLKDNKKHLVSKYSI